MHGRQHTGVSIYEARITTREEDERNGWSDEEAVEMADGEIRRERWRKKESQENIHIRRKGTEKASKTKRMLQRRGRVSAKESKRIQRDHE